MALLGLTSCDLREEKKRMPRAEGAKDAEEEVVFPGGRDERLGGCTFFFTLARLGYLCERERKEKKRVLARRTLGTRRGGDFVPWRARLFLLCVTWRSLREKKEFSREENFLFKKRMAGFMQ